MWLNVLGEETGNRWEPQIFLIWRDGRGDCVANSMAMFGASDLNIGKRNRRIELTHSTSRLRLPERCWMAERPFNVSSTANRQAIPILVWRRLRLAVFSRNIFDQIVRRILNSIRKQSRNLKRRSQLYRDLPLTLPSKVFDQNSGILPTRIQSLHGVLSAEASLDEWLPMAPFEKGFYPRLCRIFELLHRELHGKTTLNSNLTHGSASRWVHQDTLQKIIDSRIKLAQSQGLPTDVPRHTSEKSSVGSSLAPLSMGALP